MIFHPDTAPTPEKSDDPIQIRLSFCGSLDYNFHNSIHRLMGFLFALIVSSVAGGIGWWIGDFFGLAAALMSGSVASVIGWWYGVKWNREYFG